MDGGQLAIHAMAGRIPSSAEGRGQRPAAFALVDSLPAALPAGWALRLTPDHRVRLEAAAPIEQPATATGLIGAMVGFALALDPYLDRLESAGIGAGGTVKT